MWAITQFKKADSFGFEPRRRAVGSKCPKTAAECGGYVRSSGVRLNGIEFNQITSPYQDQQKILELLKVKL